MSARSSSFQFTYALNNLGAEEMYIEIPFYDCIFIYPCNLSTIALYI